eukprot:Sdes_comp18436_c0_seq1m8357
MWGGVGLLGVSIRFCSFAGANENVWHVLEVQPDSPAQKAGLISRCDYIIGSPDSMLHEEEDFYALVEAYDEKPVRFYVYNVIDDVCREVTIVPNSSWGGQGYLGCGIGYGYLHRIPTGDASSSVNNQPLEDNSTAQQIHPHVEDIAKDGFSDVQLSTETETHVSCTHQSVPLTNPNITKPVVMQPLDLDHISKSTHPIGISLSSSPSHELAGELVKQTEAISLSPKVSSSISSPFSVPMFSTNAHSDSQKSPQGAPPLQKPSVPPIQPSWDAAPHSFQKSPAQISPSQGAPAPAEKQSPIKNSSSGVHPPSFPTISSLSGPPPAASSIPVSNSSNLALQKPKYDPIQGPPTHSHIPNQTHHHTSASFSSGILSSPPMPSTYSSNPVTSVPTKYPGSPAQFPPALPVSAPPFPPKTPASPLFASQNPPAPISPRYASLG